MEVILKLEHVSKVYGNNIVVNNASFEIGKGCVCGLLGPNGAGKTTIMKIIMNELKCDNGSVYYNNDLKIKYLQDVPKFYEFYTIDEYLNFLLDICKYEKNREERIQEILNLLNLNDHKDKQIKKLLEALNLNRQVTSWDRDFYNTWVNVWKFNAEIIDYAVSLAVGKTQPMQYINKILSNWKDQGITTLQKAQQNGQVIAEVKPQLDKKPEFMTHSFSAEELNALFDNLDEVKLI